MNNMPSQRKIALYALMEVGRNYGYSNLILQSTFEKYNVSKSDKPFITALFYGVLDRVITLDYVISLWTKDPPEKLKPVTLYALRLAVFQILFMDKVPKSAAVNESVKLVKSSREKYNAAFVNAVLRNMLRAGVKLPEGNTVNELKIRYSCPEWIIESLIKDYGERTAVTILEHYQTAPDITLRINSKAVSDEQLIKSLIGRGVNARLCDIPHVAIIEGGADIKALPEYAAGLFHAQDIPSQVAVSALSIRPESRILDLCAAPGGKTFTAAQIGGGNTLIVSCDFHESRVKLIENGANRLKLGNITCLTKDSREFDESLKKFDYVICDVPCSGLGVIRRKPEIKYKTDLDFKELTTTQIAIAENGLRYLKPGGKMLYSTCTLRKAENEEIVEMLLGAHKNVVLAGEHTFLPDTDKTDGFYYAILEKSAD